MTQTILTTLVLALMCSVAFCGDFRVGSGETQVSHGTFSSSTTGWDGSPESPDGRTVAYAVYPEVLDITGRRVYDVELWVCDRKEDNSFSNHRRILGGLRAGLHYGLYQQWIDHRLLTYTSWGQAGIVDIETNEHAYGPFPMVNLGRRPHGSRVLLTNYRASEADIQVLSERLGMVMRENGIYELDTQTGEVHLVISTARLREEHIDQLKRRTELSDNVAEWHFSHFDYSPDGERIMFIFRGGRGNLKTHPQVVMFIDSDGENLLITEGRALVHTGWFADGLLLSGMLVHPEVWNYEEWNFTGASNYAFREPAEIEASREDDSVKGSIVARAGRDLAKVAVAAGPANHIAQSPDRTLIAGEVLASDGVTPHPYQLFLYVFGETKPAATIFQIPYAPVLRTGAHVDPSFSRDGRRLYYNRPVGNETSRMFCYEIPPEILDRAAKALPMVKALIDQYGN